MITFIVKAEVIYEIDDTSGFEYGVLHAENYAEAAHIVEDTFKSELCAMTLTALEDDNFAFIDEETYEKFASGDFDMAVQ